jgi:hypothetical protein
MDKKIDAQAFEAFAVKAFKLTTEDLASLYNEAGELTDFSLLAAKDSERIAKLSTDSKNQYSRGIKEAAQKLEKDIKEKYEVESDLIGVELFDFIVESKLADVKTADPTEVLKHPEVIRALNAKDKELKAKDKELIEKLKAKEDEIHSSNLFKEVETSALAEFENLNPILPGDAKKAAALKNILVGDLRKNKYQKDGEQFVVLKEDGTPLQNEHGYNVTFQDHVKGNAEKYFDFKKAEDRSSSGNNNQNQNPGTKVRKPKDKADYETMMKDNSLTSKERVSILNLAREAKIIT